MGAGVSDFFIMNPNLKLKNKFFFVFFFFLGGGGGDGRLELVNIFSKNPNLKKFFWGRGGGKLGA